jgi:hypothetical protein
MKCLENKSCSWRVALEHGCGPESNFRFLGQWASFDLAWLCQSETL